MEGKKKDVLKRNTTIALLTAITAVLIALGTVAFAKVPNLATTAPFWQITDEGTKFDFGAYVDSLEGDFDVDTRGNSQKGVQYSTMFFGVGDRWGEIETCRTEGNFVATYIKVYDMDFQEYFTSEDLIEDFDGTVQVVSLEGDVVMTKLMFDDFVRITSDARDRAVRAAAKAEREVAETQGAAQN